MDDEPAYTARRSAVYAMRGMVATSQPLASQAGLEVLMRGGNAADAAVAAAAALGVTEPTSTGPGGDCFALYYEADGGAIHALNGSGRAPGRLTLDLLREQGFGEALPPFHAHTVTVPGACAAWCDLIERHGRLGLGEALAPAVRLAEEGFPVAPLTAHFWARGVERQLRHAPGGLDLTLDGRAPRAGEVFRNPALGGTLRAVAEGGKDAFYRGALAEGIARAVQQAGGVMEAADLAAHSSTWEEPIRAQYGGVTVHECGPNGQGLAALIALNILAQHDLPPEPLSAERLHLVIEALRLAFADAQWYVADPAMAAIPLEGLLSAEYARERAALIDRGRARLDQTRGRPPAAAPDTVYLSVVDGEGNACSLVNSNYMGFGTGIVPEGMGFSLQNRGHAFSLDAAHPNALAPGKRPYHTIIAALATRADGSLYASFGVMGGFMQPQGHVQVLLGLAADGLDAQAALDRPRACIEDGTPGGTVALEEGIPLGVMARLAEMGHPMRPVAGHERAIFGRGQIITRDADSGVLCGGSDPRADGCAMGF